MTAAPGYFPAVEICDRAPDDSGGLATLHLVHPMTTPSASGPLRYPLWLGAASFGWALAGWGVALHAPALAFLPAAEGLHAALPSVTAAFILLNLGYALRALWRGVRIDRLMIVTAFQIGLFTTLFLQVAAHVGAEHYKLTKPTTPANFLNQCNGTECFKFDNAARIEAFKPGALPSLN